ncbi:E3 ubiquitin-protein ligase Mdm2 isoform X2 [Bicyclus anynana]|uniref:E3 ubiquitin-protein ligase Mdm2 isoform X2 n=1 Tax=Bicyclus anynana TaxID=110368 RepID=A0A6J1MNQ2_BICAN|nr:E3 ubiquitin-protein ligase Mdm2 isoform X2 [Bicyclus anynana]
MNQLHSSFSSEPENLHRHRRCSTETIFSIQGQETDFVCDTSDTEWLGSDGDAGVEYEPASAPDDDGPLTGDSSGHSDNDIIATKVIEVSVGDDGELQLADSELTNSSSDSEMDLHDYWLCAHCRAQNNNPMYRYCEKCFQERKNFFPPRPKRKRKRKRSTRIEPELLPRTLSQDSGVGSVANSQEMSQNDAGHCSQTSSETLVSQTGIAVVRRQLKRCASSVEESAKRIKMSYSDSGSDTDSDSDDTSKDINIDNNSVTKTSVLNDNVEISPVRTFSDSEANIDRTVKSVNDDVQVTPIVKMVSDPALTVVKTDVNHIIDTMNEKLDIGSKDLCIMCLVEPKSGVFVHGRIAHICCCYKCAVKVWSKAKRCPLCNSKVSNVLKAVVM